MILEQTEITRKFKFDNQIIEDINPLLSVEEIKDHLCGTYPKLTNAKIINKGIQENNTLLFEFQTVVGTKA